MDPRTDRTEWETIEELGRRYGAVLPTAGRPSVWTTIRQDLPRFVIAVAVVVVAAVGLSAVIGEIGEIGVAVVAVGLSAVIGEIGAALTHPTNVGLLLFIIWGFFLVGSAVGRLEDTLHEQRTLLHELQQRLDELQEQVTDLQDDDA
jgi:hypothetical protein